MSPASTPSSSSKNPATFWTVCTNCTTHFEYLRHYVNYKLCCPSCHEAFVAFEKSPPPVAAIEAVKLSSGQERQKLTPRSANRKLCISGGNSTPRSAHRNLSISGDSRPRAATLNNSGGPSTGVLYLADNPKLELGTSYRDGTKNESSPYSLPARASGNVVLPTGASDSLVLPSGASASVVRRPRGRPKKNRKEAETALKNRKAPDDHTIGNRGDKDLRIGVLLGSTSESRKGNFTTEGPHGYLRIYNQSNNRRELSASETQNMLSSKALGGICNYLENSNSVTKAKGKQKMKMQEKDSLKQKNMVYGELHDLAADDGSNEENQNKEFVAGSSGGGSGEETPTEMIIVPDSDFHDFDLDRTENSFKADQVWAVYDNEDGMPRFYAKIHDVISLNPFKMRMSWLNWRSNSELGPLNWVDSGFSITCGDFRVAKQEFTEILNSFSHNVKFTKGARRVIHIYPSKGDVWALYRNWSPDWDENTPDDVIRKYDLVEVLEDYSEEKGVSVIPLVKINRFKTVFCQQKGPREIKTIPKQEMFRFSHQVPAYMLTGEEAGDALAGCWQLDPAATPVDLPPVVDEVIEELLQSVLNTIQFEVGENSSKAGEGVADEMAADVRDDADR